MALKEILARFGIQVDSSQLVKANKGIAGAIGSLRTFGAVIAGSAVVRGFAGFVKSAVDAGDALGKTSTQLGLSVAQLESWQSAAGFAGVEATKFNQSMRVLQKNSFMAADGSKQSVDAFKKLGVSFKGSNGELKTGDQLMRDVGVALGGMENSTERVALAQVLMGRTGAALLPLFKDGEAGLAALQRRFEEFGGPVGEDFVKLAEDAKDKWQDFDTASGILKSRLATALLPSLNQLTTMLARGAAAMSKVVANGSSLSAMFVALGVAVAQVGFSKLAAVGVRGLLSIGKAVLAPLLKFALLFLIVDDLITLFNGGESAIGKFLDKLGGEGTAANFVKEMKLIGGSLADLVVNFGTTTTSADGFITDNETRFTAFASSLASSTDQIVSDFAEAWELIKVDLDNLVDKFYEVGDEMIQGLIDGIVAKAGDAVEAVKNIGKSIIKGAKQTFQSKSPSKVFEAEGVNNIDGLILGMTKAARTATKLGSAAALQASGAGSLSAPAAGGGAAPAGGGAGGMVFKSDIHLTVTGGSPTDGQINKLRQGVRGALDDNRRATLAAFQQQVAP